MVDFIEWPTGLLTPEDCRANPTPFTRTGGRSLGGVEPATRTDLGYWTIDLVDIAIHDQDQRRTWQAIRQFLSGRAGLIAVPAWSRDTGPYVSGDFEPPSDVLHDDDTLFDDDTPYEQDAISVATDGVTPIGASTIKLRRINAANDLVGVRFSYNHALYETGPVISRSGDVWTVPISPSIRAEIPDGATLNFDAPTCLCRLTDDRGMDGGVNSIEFEQRTVSFVEATDWWNSLAVAD